MNEFIMLVCGAALFFFSLWIVVMLGCTATEYFGASSVSPFDNKGNKVAKAFHKNDVSSVAIENSRNITFRYNDQHFFFSDTTQLLYLVEDKDTRRSRKAYSLNWRSRRIFRSYMLGINTNLNIRLYPKNRG
jgi:hypothetical protein